MLGWLYTQIADIRNRFYDNGTFESFSLGAPTISVGNITAGGTGKTPLVAYIASLLHKKGEFPCVISRGYGRKDPGRRVLVSNGSTVFVGPEEAGDEPYELAWKLATEASVISDADRVAAAAWAKKELGATAFVLDDAFQHRRARRDLDIVCIDALKPFRFLREPLRNLRRASAIVITRANLTDDVDRLKLRIRKYNPDCPLFTASSRTIGLRSHDNPDDYLPENIVSKAVAFCGLGNPENFFEQLKREGFDIVAVKAFRDHHVYKQRDIDVLEKMVKSSGASILLTTMKDRAKLKGLQFKTHCLCVESELVFDDEEDFRNLIYKVLEKGDPG